jgi:2-polyprenyl-3-methyl-5-hydroxy-6-metoxy-1,4-benzoquinol methylase
MNLVGARSTKEYLAQEINALAGHRVLDIGCGTATILNFLPGVSYFGIDSNPNYIAKASHAFGRQGNFRCISVDDLTGESAEKFDRILLLGVLHHLTDQQIQSLVAVIKELLSENGRLITYDGVFVPKQNPIARLLLKLDRGRYVRSEQDYLSLLSTVLSVSHSHVRHDFLRIPYSVLFTTSVRGGKI